MKIICCGDRNWTNTSIIEKMILELAPHHIIHGAAPGVDSIAGQIGNKLGIIVTSVPAQWDLLGQVAGPIRNTAMLKMKPDLVIAFHNNIQKSKGTKNMILQSIQQGVHVRLYNKDGDQLFAKQIEGGKGNEFSCTWHEPGEKTRLI